MAIHKEGLSIVDTRVPAIATPLSLELRPHRSRILLVGRHQGECQLFSPGLHCITLASSRRGMFRNKDVRRLRLDLGPDGFFRV